MGVFLEDPLDDILVWLALSLAFPYFVDAVYAAPSFAQRVSRRYKRRRLEARGLAGIEKAAAWGEQEKGQTETDAQTASESDPSSDTETDSEDIGVSIFRRKRNYTHRSKNQREPVGGEPTWPTTLGKPGVWDDRNYRSNLHVSKNVFLKICRQVLTS